MQVRNLLHMALLIFQLAQIQTVGAVDKINGWDEEQRRFPIEFVVEPANRSRNAGSDQVVRERPEVALHQNLSKRLPFTDRNHDGNASCIYDEIGRSRNT